MISQFEARKIMEDNLPYNKELDKIFDKIQNAIKNAAQRYLNNIIVNVGDEHKIAEDLKIIFEKQEFYVEILDSGVDGLYLSICW